MEKQHIITVAALGPDSADLLTMGALHAMKQADALVLRTNRHGAAALLDEQGVQYKTLDALYERCEDFDELCRMAAAKTRGDLRHVFSNLYQELQSRKLPDAGSCMYAAIRQTGEIPPGIRRLLIQLGNSLGQFDLPGQLTGIRSVRKRCLDSLENIRKNRDAQLRCYQTLGVCAGAALAVVLI